MCNTGSLNSFLTTFKKQDPFNKYTYNRYKKTEIAL